MGHRAGTGTSTDGFAAAARSRGWRVLEILTLKTCFVIQGFGEKTDLSTGRVLNLDASYEVIKEAVQKAGLRCVRADEIIHSGTIDKPMYEWLFRADLVIADLSTYNVNAAYELGLRYGVRPGTTMIIAENGFKNPFDVGHIVTSDTSIWERTSVDKKPAIHGHPRDAHSDAHEGVEAGQSRLWHVPHLAAPGGNRPDESDRCRGKGGRRALARPCFRRRAAGTSGRRDPAVGCEREQPPRLWHARRWTTAAFSKPRGCSLRSTRCFPATSPSCSGSRSRPTRAGRRTWPPRFAKRSATSRNWVPPRRTIRKHLGCGAPCTNGCGTPRSERAHLDEAVATYERGFYLKQDYYNGINLAFLLNVRAQARREAGDLDEATADYSAGAPGAPHGARVLRSRAEGGPDLRRRPVLDRRHAMGSGGRARGSGARSIALKGGEVHRRLSWMIETTKTRSRSSKSADDLDAPDAATFSAEPPARLWGPPVFSTPPSGAFSQTTP